MSQTILIATDAAPPQINGVVRTMGIVAECLRAAGHRVESVGPSRFRSVALPSYPEIPLAFATSGAMEKIARDIRPDHIHIVTEGPVGRAMRRACLRNGWRYTSAYHTRFPEYLRARLPVPIRLSHAVLKRFHGRGAATLVPTASIAADLKERGYEHLQVWTRGVDRELFRPDRAIELDLPRPIFLNVGRVATEKNIEAFLGLDLPGTKLVIGDGPQRKELERRFPNAVFLGAKSGIDLAAHFAAADVFVFPSRTDTFGLVLLEALASGLPVAAYPVPGPADVLAEAGPAAGVCDEDLGKAALAALKLSRVEPDDVLQSFSWRACTDIFLDTLVPAGLAPLGSPAVQPITA
ncbi:glycosyltransferase family 1 protein [Notoacmeibacter sp. MSK16QG-6]|uniref:glycosyltransferase family 4 protein n=1 Tax=Notoacmeibacter sp. MSK16QG-6 TaxID=2957982 RepID=UPI00209FE599|nr:glycosyltransferase family 1 protein [Notoacmeibacter sp. MSK16QG-6]MCP1199135.1 glycosyltransferase family 1 protein [Notoacmeibacter sp. MSK16QG-6]